MWFFGKKANATAIASESVQGWTRIFDWKSGAWQANMPYEGDEAVLSHPTVFACQTLIASDISKLRLVFQRVKDDIWVDWPQHKFVKLMKRPNSYQNTIQFLEAWVHSKLSHGNTYVLKEFNPSGQIVALHVLEAMNVTPLISESGEVFYRLAKSALAGLDGEDITIPARYLIHDRFNCLYHPLIGLSPIFAAAIPALTGLTAQKNMSKFFVNGSNPSGVLTAPGPITDSTALRLKTYWEESFSKDKIGGVAVAGDGLTFQQMRMSNVDAQVIQLMGWNDAKICAVYHVPSYMVGVGEMPKFDNIEALTQAYYSQCLQILIESLEQLMDYGLGIVESERTQLDVDGGLFRMDSATRMETMGVGITKGLVGPNEGRKKLNLPAVEGGDTPYLQEQNHSLAFLALRDSQGIAPPEPQPNFDEAIKALDDLLYTVKLF